jgi:ABC-type sugar transport system ATPase subunit
MGIAYLPRDRRAKGIFPSLSVLDNFAIASPGRDTVAGLLISAGRRRTRYEAYRERLAIAAPGPQAPITTLSGGNQQKVLLPASWRSRRGSCCSMIRRAASTSLQDARSTVFSASWRGTAWAS